MPALLAAAAFAPTVGFDFVNWDDDWHVYANPVVTGRVPVFSSEMWNPKMIGYPIPVTLLSYLANNAVHGLQPIGYHAVNVGLHALAAALVALLLLRFGVGRLGALAGALVFAVHPVVVEPVAWVTGRKDLLAAVFALASAWAWMRPGGRARWAILSSAFFVLSALSKPYALLVPLFWLVPALFGERRRQALASLVVWGAVVAGLGALLASAPPRGWSMELSSDLVPRILRTVGAHLGLVCWPADLLPRYILPPPTFTEPRSILGLAAILGLAGVILVRRARRHPIGRGVLFAALAFAPVAGLFPNPRALVDSYLYLPLAGLVVLVGFGVEALAGALEGRRARSAIVGAATVALPLALLPAALDQSTIWRDGRALWGHMLTRYSDSPQVCRFFGNALFEKADYASAARVYATCAKTQGRPELFRANYEEAMRRLRANQR